MFGVVITKILFVSFIILSIIFFWFSKHPTCSIVALEIIKSDENCFISVSEKSDVIDLFKDFLKISKFISLI